MTAGRPQTTLRDTLSELLDSSKQPLQIVKVQAATLSLRDGSGSTKTVDLATGKILMPASRKSWEEMSVAERIDVVVHDSSQDQPPQPDPEIELLKRLTPEERVRYNKRIIRQMQYS